MLIQTLSDPFKHVKRSAKRGRAIEGFFRKILDIQNRHRIERFFRKKMLDSCKLENRGNNNVQTKFNNSFAEFKCKSDFKSNFATKTVISSHVIFLPKILSVQSYLIMDR